MEALVSEDVKNYATACGVPRRSKAPKPPQELLPKLHVCDAA